MKVILFGSTGMVGQGALRECLLAQDVQSVAAVVRKSSKRQDPKLREIVHENFLDFSALRAQWAGFDACFFCIGVSTVDVDEKEYTRLTYDVPLAAARLLAEINPGMTWVHVSAAGADPSERGRTMWARVKGKTENALRALPFKAVYILRPGMIEPLHGITSRTRVYRILYALCRPLLPLVHALLPNHITTTERIGRAMLQLVRSGYTGPILGNADINRVAAATR